jgi:Ca-activated chloride channel family protein
MNSKKLSRLVISVLFVTQASCSLSDSKKIRDADEHQQQENPLQQDASERPVGAATIAPIEKSEDLYSNYELHEHVAADKISGSTKRTRAKDDGKEFRLDQAFSGSGRQASVAMNQAAKYKKMPSLSVAAGGPDDGNGRLAESPSMHKNYDSKYYRDTSNESYDGQSEGQTFRAKKDPLSTFSIDVDTASYSNMRRFIQMNQKPPQDAVRIEEMINYFSYNYEKPKDNPFSVNLEMAQSPWNKSKKLVGIGIKGKEIQVEKRPSSNLVFLIDVSGSMDTPEKLPLVKSALGMMVDKLNKNDRISIVVYAGAAGLVLKPTPGNMRAEILRALDQLKAGGSTNGSGGIELAYKTASDEFIKGGVNRVILASDGDFNVGVTSRDQLVKLIAKNAEKNIYLTILGFGMGNYKDGTMEALSHKGNGNYAYIDNHSEARKVMVEQLSGTLVTIAKDVKIQVEFNPKLVESYRLIGYENRILEHKDFNDDKKDAGDIGAGHTVTALYEVTPVGSVETTEPGIDGLKYQVQEKALDTKIADQSNANGELLTVKLRYKKPDGFVSKKIEIVLNNSNRRFQEASESFKFATAVAMFGMSLRNSEHMKNTSLSEIKEIAENSKGDDANGYKKEFITLIEKYEKISTKILKPMISYAE